MKKSRLVLIGAAILMTACALLVLADGRPDMPPENLLLDASYPDFPDHWESDSGSVSVVWQVSSPIRYTILTPSYTESMAGREWTNRGEVSPTPLVQITQYVFRYHNPVEGAIGYWLLSPELTATAPNFELSGGYSRRYPADWGYRSSSASQQQVVCGMGTPDRCQAWYYWARYGQFIMEVRFFAPNLGMGSGLFEQVVSEMDSIVHARLAR